MSSIVPSIGRKVWYWPAMLEGATQNVEGMAVNDPDQALDATVLFVADSDHVSIAIQDHAGTPHVRHGVWLVDFESRRPGVASWMPYQEKAAKAAAPEPLPGPPNAGPIETKVYSDGSSATGPGPLPDLSPAQQDAAIGGAPVGPANSDAAVI